MFVNDHIPAVITANVVLFDRMARLFISEKGLLLDSSKNNIKLVIRKSGSEVVKEKLSKNLSSI